MNTADNDPPKSRWLSLNAGASSWLWLAGVIIVLDQWTKRVVSSALELYETREVLPVFNITLLHNEGAAFSFLANAGGWQRWFFVVLAVVVSGVILAWLRRLPARGQTMLAIGLALILGGALGNVIDRALLGYVVDFIQVHYGGWFFPSFNVADSAITVGAGLVIIDSFRTPKDNQP